jgi:dTDP-4-dehydrorhamnose 3,5-epimerase
VVILEPTALPGTIVVRPERRDDERGFFARVWCREEFAAHGVAIDIAQASVSHNRRAGTLRGLHYAIAPASEGKLVRCERGRIFDVALDLRPQSPAFLRHVALQLAGDDPVALYLPPGVAHGFQTLEDDSTVLYMMSEAYRPELAAGVRFDDPAFGIAWPLPVSVITERDRGYVDFDRARHAESGEPPSLADAASRQPSP